MHVGEVANGAARCRTAERCKVLSHAERGNECTQQAIVAEIEAEQALVNANRELIARFEKKIQATLARIWGEEEPSPAKA